MNLQIHRLGLSTLCDYLEFFGNRAFSDNPDWAGCYCLFNHFTGTDEEWMRRGAALNRKDAIAMIQSGELSGYLAYDSDEPIGWCNAGPRSAYKRFTSFPTTTEPGKRVCAVTCFIVMPVYRRMGVARALLSRATEDFLAQGYDIMEAYPTMADGSCAMHYHGHPGLFLSEGFSLCQRFGEYGYMKKDLSKDNSHEND